LQKPASERKRGILQAVHDHLYPGRVLRLDRGGIDFVPDRREGYRYWDADGRELLDLHLNGGTFNLGHCNPRLVELLQRAAPRWDIGNHHFPSEPKARLAKALIAAMPGDMRYVVLTASGSEANDVAIKSARFATGRRKVVALAAGYYGRTGLSGAAGDDSAAAYFHSDYPGEFVKVPFNDLPAMERALAGGDVALVMMETIPATSGFPLPAAGYLPAVKALCGKHGTLYLADEVQTGLGRTGFRWGVEAFGVVPDMIVTGKGLSGGLYPMAAVVMCERAGAWLRENGWGHVSTFGGSDLGCHVALEALEMSLSEETLANVRARAEYLRAGLEKLQPRFPFFRGIRQQGLVMGLEFADSAHGQGMMRALYESGIWAITAGFDESVIQFKPGLLIDQAYCDEVLRRFENACIWLANNLFALMTGGNPPEDDPVLAGVRALAGTALAHWNLGGAPLELVKHRENTIFKVTAADGRAYALRVHRHGYHTDAELQSEIDWMRTLSSDGCLETPTVVPTVDGRDFVTVRHERVPQPRQVSVIEWINGTAFDNLGRVERGVEAELKERYRKLGALAGRLHRHSATHRPPAGFTRPAWDEAGLVGEQPLWGRFWEHPKVTREQRALMRKARIVLDGLLKQIGKDPEHYGLIHADFLPENVLVEDGHMRLIDFDDSGWGWYLFEVAASVFPHVNQPFFDALLAEYVAGYRTERELSTEHEALIPAFIMLRGFSYLGWLKTRAGAMPNADRVAEEVSKALSGFIPELLAELTPLQRVGVNVLAMVKSLRD
jgi:acetylornithine/succinyldiaminopimelate/putrescine aminotransferase/Ser/Thr protein kinase RdoA (MazF antagonist)